jgi:hypothetical protein
LTPKDTEPWAKAFTDLFGEKSLLYTDGFAEREAVALGYEVVKADYRISDILRRAGIRNDTETLSDDYEFTFADELEQDEADVLSRVYALTDILGAEIPKNTKIFKEYANHEGVRGMYNPNTCQIYLRQSVLSAGLEETLSVYLHEANHHSQPL